MKTVPSKSIATITILVAFCCLTTVTAQAKGGGGHRSKPARYNDSTVGPQQNKTSDPTLVTGVNTTAKTVTLQTGKKQPELYSINGFTRITVNGKSATLEKIEPGMRADIAIGSDPTILTKIDLTNPDTNFTSKK